MVAPNNIQSVQLSPSFPVKDVKENHIQENIMAQLLEMKSESSAIPSSTPTGTSSAKISKKSVTFSDDIQIHENPTLTQEEKEDMFLNKQDKQNAMLHTKRLVAAYRAGRMPEEEKTKVGMEAHLNPHMNMSIRRRMTRAVLQHQRLSRQNPSSSFDDLSLAKKCATVAKSATFLALGRAQIVIKELAIDDKLQDIQIQ